MTSQAHILVIGGGPAGLAAAIAARQKGLRVLVADACSPPLDKPCGEGLLPPGVEALRSLGVELSSEVAFPFRSIRFADEDASATAPISQQSGFGLRRTTLHRMLIDRATALGVELLWNARISLLRQQRLAVNGEPFEPTWYVGADGRNSAVRSWAGLAPPRPGRARFGFRRHYRVVPWTDSVEVYWGEKSQIVVTPTGPSEVCVVIFSEDRRLRLDRALPMFPQVASKLEGAQSQDAERGDQTASWRLPRVTRGRVALVGDASGTADALTGCGLSLAFQQALQLAEAFERDVLKHYESEHRRLMRTPRRMSRLLLAMAESAQVRGRAIRLFQSRPELFARLLTVHTSLRPDASIGARDILGLGWRILWA